MINWAKIKGDLLLAAAPNVFQKFVSYIIIVILARHLSKDDIGAFFFAATVASIAALFTELGTTPYLTRRIAAAPRDAGRAISEVLSLRLPLIALVYAALNTVVALFYSAILVPVALSTVYTFLVSLYAAFSAVFLGLGKVVYRTVTDIAAQVILLVLVYLAIRAQAGLPTILGCYITANLALLVAAACLVYARISRFSLVGDFGVLLNVARKAAPLFILIVFSVLHFKVDSLMLGVMSSLEAVATYEAAYKFLEVSQIIVRPVPMIFLPLCASLVTRQQWATLRQIIRRVLIGAGSAGVIIGVVVIAAAPAIIELVFGAAYASSSAILQVLFLALPAVYLAFVGSVLANAHFLEKKLIYITLVCLIVNVGLNFVVIPRWGALGAAWTTFATEILLAIWILAVLLGHVGRAYTEAGVGTESRQ